MNPISEEERLSRIARSNAMEQRLVSEGYSCPERVTFDEKCIRRKDAIKLLSRFTYEKGRFRVLTETDAIPWWTVQNVRDGLVWWFVDFPLDVSLDAVFAFIQES